MKEFKGFKIPGVESLHCYSVGCVHLDCQDCLLQNRDDARIALAEYIATHKTPIDQLYVPFGMLSEEKQKELRNKTTKENAEFYIGGSFIKNNGLPLFDEDSLYRISKTDPKADEIAQLTKRLEELGAITDGKIIK